MTKIVTIHGTNAGDQSEVGEQWWQRESAFQKRLAELVQPTSGDLEFVPFHWSGKNSERERRSAGEALRRRVSEFEKAGEPYAILGHSHGGSVANHALFAAHAKGWSLNGLKRWITVGTPFIDFWSRRWLVNNLSLIGLVALVGALTFLVIALSQAVEFGDDLGGTSLNSRSGLRIIAVGIATALAAGIIIFATTARARKRNAARHRKAFWQSFGDRWTSFWHASDEAISGLKAARKAHVDLLPFAAARKALASLFVVIAVGGLAATFVFLRVPDTQLARVLPDSLRLTNATFLMGGVIHDMAFSGDGRWLITGYEGGFAQVWDAKTLEPAYRLGGLGGFVRQTAISDDGRIAVITAEFPFAGENGQSRFETQIWRVGEQQPRHVLPNLTVVALSGDGNVFLTAEGDECLESGRRMGCSRLQVRKTDDPSVVASTVKGAGILGAIQLSKDGDIAALGGWAGSISIIDTQSGVELAATKLLVEEPADMDPGWDTIIGVSLSEDGREVHAITAIGASGSWRIDRTEQTSSSALQPIRSIQIPFDEKAVWWSQDISAAALSDSGTRAALIRNRSWEVWELPHPLNDLDTAQAVLLGSGGIDFRIPPDETDVAISASGDTALMGDTLFDGTSAEATALPQLESGERVRIPFREWVIGYTGVKVSSARTADTDSSGGARNGGWEPSEDTNVLMTPQNFLQLAAIPGYWVYVRTSCVADELLRVTEIENTLRDGVFERDAVRSGMIESRERDPMYYSDCRDGRVEGRPPPEDEAGDAALERSLHVRAAIKQALEFGVFFLVGAAAWVAGVVVAYVVLWPTIWLLNRFLFTQVRNMAYGNDTYGEAVAGVSEKGQVKFEDVAAPHWGPLPPPLSNEVETYTENFAVETLQKVRKLLGMHALSPTLSLADAVAEQLSWRELIHTAYFDIDGFTKLVAIGLCRSGLVQPTQALLDDPAYGDLNSIHDAIAPESIEQ